MKNGEQQILNFKLLVVHREGLPKLEALPLQAVVCQGNCQSSISFGNRFHKAGAVTKKALFFTLLEVSWVRDGAQNSAEGFEVLKEREDIRHSYCKER